MKVKLSIIALLLCALTASSQVYVDSTGMAQVGPVRYDYHVPTVYGSVDTLATLLVNGKGPVYSKGKIVIGDNTNYNKNVSVGELIGTGDGDTDKLWLQGKKGTYITSTQTATDTIFFYDVTKGNYAQFNCDVHSTGVFVASDSRFKDDIEPLDRSLPGLTALSPVSYRLKPRLGEKSVTGHGTADDEAKPMTEKELRDKDFFDKFHKELENDTPRYGFLAQEVKEVYPELVRTDDNGYMYVDYMGMIPLLVQAINELNAEVESLRSSQPAEPQKAMSAPASAGEIEVGEVRNALFQNSPNPFNASTEIRLTLRDDVSQAQLLIFDLQGKMLKSLAVVERGNVTVTVQASELPAGMYIYSLIADGKEIGCKKMILTK